jgi:hypothetical protein
MTTARTRDLIDAGWAWDGVTRQWIPPGALFGALPQTRMPDRKRRRALIEIKQTLLKLLEEGGKNA